MESHERIAEIFREYNDGKTRNVTLTVRKLTEGEVLLHQLFYSHGVTGIEPRIDKTYMRRVTITPQDELDKHEPERK